MPRKKVSRTRLKKVNHVIEIDKLIPRAEATAIKKVKKLGQNFEMRNGEPCQKIGTQLPDTDNRAVADALAELTGD